MRELLPFPMDSRYAVFASTACTSRKSSFSAPATVPGCHVTPPSVVRRKVPPVPLAHTTLALTTLTPRRLALVFDVCGFHCASAVLASRINVGSFILTRDSVDQMPAITSIANHKSPIANEKGAAEAAPFFE